LRPKPLEKNDMMSQSCCPFRRTVRTKSGNSELVVATVSHTAAPPHTNTHLDTWQKYKPTRNFDKQGETITQGQAPDCVTGNKPTAAVQQHQKQRPRLASSTKHPTAAVSTRARRCRSSREGSAKRKVSPGLTTAAPLACHVFYLSLASLSGIQVSNRTLAAYSPVV